MAEFGEKYLNIYTWKIENFICANKELKSPPICIENLNNSKWFLKVKREEINTNGYVSCYLVQADQNNKVSEVVCMLELLDEDSKSIMKRQFSFRPFDKECEIGCQNFISYSEVADVLAQSKENTLTVRCRIGGGTFCPYLSVEWEAKSLVEAFSYSFTDKLKLSWTMTKNIKFENLKLTIILTETQDDIKINFQSDKGLYYMFVCQVSFLKNGNELFKQISSCCLHCSSWNFPTIKKSSLKKLPLNDRSLTVLFEMSFSNGEVSHIREFIPSNTSVSPISSRHKDPVTVLQEDLRLMLDDKIGCDVQLRAGDEIFSAHKSTLSARSPVFKAMFDQDMVENKTGIVDISDTDAKTLKTFLVFCYNATVDEELDLEKAMSLLIMADKYQVGSLKETCSSVLMSLLNDGNVCQVLEVVDRIGNQTLKEFSMRIIRKSAEKIFSSIDWSQCVAQNARLTTEILQKIVLESYI